MGAGEGELELGDVHIAMKTNGVTEEDIAHIAEEEKENCDWALGNAKGDGEGVGTLGAEIDEGWMSVARVYNEPGEGCNGNTNGGKSFNEDDRYFSGHKLIYIWWLPSERIADWGGRL